MACPARQAARPTRLRLLYPVAECRGNKGGSSPICLAGPVQAEPSPTDTTASWTFSAGKGVGGLESPGLGRTDPMLGLDGVGPPAEGGGGGAPDGAACPTARPLPPVNAKPDTTAPAVATPLITVIRVLPISARTIRPATNGMRATMIDNSTLATLITITWVEPTKACRNDPLNCMGSVICRADISACRMAYSRPQQWKIIKFTK
jgi:hypothetical protein